METTTHLGTEKDSGEQRLESREQVKLRPEVVSVFREARKAQQGIAVMTVAERLACLKRLRQLIVDEKEDLVTKVCAETGKSRTDCLASEIFGICDVLSFLVKHGASAIADEKVPTPLPLMGKASKVYYEPRGVVLVISPWNYPLFQTIVPSMFSFVAGNATILKPSEVTPLKGVIEKLLDRAGFPQNAVQVLYGDGAVGAEAIAAHPDFISFTGGVVTGKKVMKLASDYLIPVELELGGSDAALVFEDVNLKRTVAGLVWGAFTNGGQSCSSVERIFVADKVYEAFLHQFVDETRRLVTASGDALSLDMGTMTVLAQAVKVHELVQDAVAKGARVHTGGTWDGKSFNYPPTVLTGVTSEMRIYHEEVFGPVVVISRFASEAEAVGKANDSRFGLSASVWTKDLERADRVTRLLDVGSVSINNVMLTEGNAALPFGGTKESGIGRIKGRDGLRALCRVKAVIVDKQSKKIEANWYPFTPKKYQLFGELIGFFRGGARGLWAFVSGGLRLESHAQKPRQ